MKTFRDVVLGVALGLTCTAAGMLIERHIIWTEKPAAYRQWQHQQSWAHKPIEFQEASIKTDCSAKNVQAAKDVIHVCYKEKLRQRGLR